MSKTRVVDAILRSMPREGAVLEVGKITASTGSGQDIRVTVDWGGQSVENVPAIGDGIEIGQQAWLLRSGTTMIALIGGAALRSSLVIRGSVADLDELYALPGPFEHGDGWIVRDTGNVWAWTVPPGEFQDYGPYATTDHIALSNVTPDQHHAKSHVHDGVDGSGLVEHVKTTGQGEDDHHPKQHVHDGNDGSGSIAHGDTTGRTPNDHHPQLHPLYGADHSDVNHAPALSPRVILAQPSAIGDWTPETRMNWRGDWIAGTYHRHDVVRDGDWTMIANKETVDRAGPEPDGAPANIYAGADPTTQQLAKQIIFGQRYTIDAGLWDLQGVRVYTIAGNTYEVYYVDDPDGENIVKLISSFTATLTGWRDIAVTGGLVGPGFEFEALTLVQEPDPTPTIFTGDWDYDTPNNPATPLSGQISHANTEAGVLRVHKTDNDGVDRSADLSGMVVGDVIQFNQPDGTRYAIQTIVDNGSWFYFSVAPAVQSTPDGVTSFGFETVTASPITYMDDLGYWTANPLPNATIVGRLKIDDGAPVTDDNAYGADLLVQPYTSSDDWNLVATSASAGGGGDDGGGSGPGLPIGGLTDQALTKVDNTDGNVQWSGPYLPLSDKFGGAHSDLTGIATDDHHARYTDAEAISAVGPHTPQVPQTFLHADLTDVSPDQHHARYTDSEAVTAVGPHTPPFTPSNLHADLTDVGPDDHHARYTDSEAITAVGPHTPAFVPSGLHADLTDVTADQHHPQLHDLDSHTDVGAGTPVDGHILTFDEVLGEWVPKQSQSALGIVTFNYNIKNATTTPAAGKLAGNVDDPITATTMYVNRVDGSGEDISTFLLNLENGAWINIYDRTDSSIHRSFDVTGVPVLTGDVFAVPITFHEQAGAALTDEQAVTLYLRFVSADDFDGAHSSLSNIQPDDHHTRYSDAEAVSAVGPHTPAFTPSNLHADLIDIGSDDHHARYTDAEAITAVGPHPTPPPQTFLHADLTDVSPDQHHTRYTDSEAVSAVGTPWVGLYLPLAGGTLTGYLTLNADPTTDLHAATKQYVDTEIGGIPAPVLDHDGLTNVTSDQHHPRYDDTEAVAAMGLIDNTNALHHNRYSDQEAIDAVGTPWVTDYLPLAGGTMLGYLTLNATPVNDLHAATKEYVDSAIPPPAGTHTVGSTAPPSPQTGDVWVDPDASAEGTYLPLAGGTLTGNLVMDGGYLTIQRSGSGMMWLKRTGVAETEDGWFQLQIQSTSGLSIYGGSLDGVTKPQIELVRFKQDDAGFYTDLTHNPPSVDGVDSSSRFGAYRNAFGMGIAGHGAYGMYFGSTTGSQNAQTAAIEALWDTSSGNVPMLSVGVVRDLAKAHARFRYDGITQILTGPSTVALQLGDGYLTSYQLFRQYVSGTQRARWNTDGSAQFFPDASNTRLYVKTDRVELMGGSSGMIGYATGMSYGGSTHGGKSKNIMSFTWGSSSIWGTIDNVVTIQLAAASDRKMKSNIVPMVGAVEEWKLLPPSYRYNPIDLDPDTGALSVVEGVESIGMIADEMADVKPEWVTGDGLPAEVEEDVAYTDEDGMAQVRTETRTVETYQTINYPNVDGLGRAVISELIERIEALENA